MITAVLLWQVFVVSPQAGSSSVLTAGEGTDRYIFTHRDCWFDVSWRQSLICGDLSTPSTHGQFNLPVVVIKSDVVDSDKEPLLYLSGGPGDPAHLEAQDMPFWFSWYERAGLKRDLVLIDRRGTGLSKPRRDCQAYTDFSRHALARNLSMTEELSAGQKVIKACIETLKRQGFSSDNYGTERSARDMQGLMQALGYSRWHLFGVSYGTRLALSLLALNPDAIDSVILDSVYPKGKGRLTEWPWLLKRSLDNFFRYCQQQASCHTTEQDTPGAGSASLRQRFWQAMVVLQQTPLTLTVKSWYGDAPFTVVINDHRFLSALFSALYDRTLIDKIPAAIESVLDRDARGLQGLIEPFINYAFDPQFNSMVFMAVECGEMTQESEVLYSKAVEKYPRLAPYTEALWQYDSCRDWLTRDGAVNDPAGEEEAALQAISRFEHVPALILSGGLDPVTPWQWGQVLSQRWSRSQQLHFPNTGHSVVGSEDCAHKLIEIFLSDPHQKISYSSCVEP